jgi:hypothetical protein
MSAIPISMPRPRKILDFRKRSVSDGSGDRSAIVVKKLIEPDLT